MKLKLKNTPLASLICVSLLGSAALSQAGVSTGDIIGVTFGQTNVATTMSGAAVIGASGDQWNNLRFNGSVNALGSVALNKTTGASSGVSLAVSTGDGSGDITNAGLDLYDGNMFLSPNNTGPATITISGLGAGTTIDLYLYAGAGHTAGEGATFNFGSDKSATDPNVAENAYVLGENYVLFSGLVADGSGTISGTWSRNSGSDYSAFDGMQIAVTATTGTDYELWANSFIPPIGLPAEDDDNDGVTNQEEYAFGLIPNSGASVNPISAQLDKTNGTFSYTRRNPSLPTPALSYSIWYSTDLVAWAKDTGATEGTTSLNGDVQTVPVTLSAAPGSPLPAKLFIQVRAD